MMITRILRNAARKSPSLLRGTLTRPYSTPSSSRPAIISTSALPDTSDTSYLPPQPFIPRPFLRTPQVQSLSKPLTTPNATTINFTGSRQLTLPNLFLRDSSIHTDHLHPASQQKLFRTTDVPFEGDVVGFGVQQVDGQDVLVTEWSTPMLGVNQRSAKLSVLKMEVLLGLLEEQEGTTRKNVPGRLPPLETWDAQSLSATISSTSCNAFMTSPSSLQSTLTSLISTGIALLRDVPTEKKEGHQTSLKDVVERMGTLRRTWYGDLWDVKAEEGSKNIAYTNLDLGLHMDLTYKTRFFLSISLQSSSSPISYTRHFDSPPRYQFLHCLLNSSIIGGSSYFVDSYHIANILRHSHPSHFHTLSTIPLLFSYKNGGKWTRFERPTIELDPLGTGAIKAVNYSPPFQDPLPISSANRDLHEALNLFAKLTEKEELTYRKQLGPGDLVMFDNRRVLHARTAFDFADIDAEAQGEGKERGRWLKGAYMDGDEVFSTWRMLEEGRSRGMK